MIYIKPVRVAELVHSMGKRCSRGFLEWLDREVLESLQQELQPRGLDSYVATTEIKYLRIGAAKAELHKRAARVRRTSLIYLDQRIEKTIRNFIGAQGAAVTLSSQDAEAWKAEVLAARVGRRMSRTVLL